MGHEPAGDRPSYIAPNLLAGRRNEADSSGVDMALNQGVETEIGHRPCFRVMRDAT
jgi:hypothetical protein